MTDAGPAPAQFICQPCDGLADAIERHDTPAIQALGHRYLEALWSATPTAPRIDTIVLGCTHYPFALEALAGLLRTEPSTGWTPGCPCPEEPTTSWPKPGTTSHPATAWHAPTFITTGDLATWIARCSAGWAWTARPSAGVI